MPDDYEVYATYETTGNLEDKKLHKLIDTLNPELRVSENREFFMMSAEDSYSLLEAIAIVSGSQARLRKAKESAKENIIPDEAVNSNARKPRIDFYLCGLKQGDQLIYVEDPNVVATVYDNRKVLYNGEITSLSGIVKSIKHTQAEAGPSFFTYNDEPLTDIAMRTQWKDFYSF